jgi:hypothetical protein
MFCLNKSIFLVIYKRVFNSRPRICDEVNQNVCERFTSLSLNCYGSDCNIDYSLCLCCFLRAPCECLSLLSCLSLSGEKCFAPLRSLVEQFAPHSTHVHDSNLNLSACIRMLVSVLTLRYYPGGGERFALLSFFPVRVSLCVCLNPLYYDGGCCSESNLCLTHTS